MVINSHYQFIVFLFGLSAAPREFTECMAVVAAFLHKQQVQVQVFLYLNDWLIKGHSRSEVEAQVVCEEVPFTSPQPSLSLVTAANAVFFSFSLEFLYLGGNFITSIPPELANLPSLSYLVLSDNKIQSIPPQLAQLHSLRSLSLHNNLLTYLPREILNLVHLEELSLRGNPLVVRFVRDLTYNPPSLLELAGRTMKTRNIPYAPSDLPGNLVRYLSLASNCPNPKCGGVYFDSCVRQIKFVDFCGKYRLPLMHYLCSPECSSPCSSASQSSTSQSESDSEDEAIVAAHRMQKVLLG
ncbi:leucine-rich repeat-containing protein 58 [Terrapene carolina triunguis]|uniref:leucine-rich repeat-containing protein 58 n=1 Tax=Terrapene triunguis TaxID=2587831 RepID=UPI001156B652|nr:leucine-rich repeat-containing protein 58 [Terrapene carolina triunguis]